MNKFKYLTITFVILNFVTYSLKGGLDNRAVRFLNALSNDAVGYYQEDPNPNNLATTPFRKAACGLADATFAANNVKKLSAKELAKFKKAEIGRLKFFCPETAAKYGVK